MMVTGGSRVYCSHCRKSRRKGTKGIKWFRRHRMRNVRCWDWKITWEDNAATMGS